MAIKFAPNAPVTLCFPFGDFKPIDGSYGPQFLYTVEVDGEREKLFAAPPLHEQLQAAQIARGDILTITKVKADHNRSGWLVRSADGSSPTEPAPPPPNSPTPTNGRPPTGRPDFAALELLMHHSLAASWRAWKAVGADAHFTSEDVRGCGITLFLQCSRHGVMPPRNG